MIELQMRKLSLKNITQVPLHHTGGGMEIIKDSINVFGTVLPLKVSKLQPPAHFL